VPLLVQAALGPGTHDQAFVVVHRIPAPALEGVPESTNVRDKVIAVQGRQGRLVSLERHRSVGFQSWQTAGLEHG
jgi:hypothetical protein